MLCMALAISIDNFLDAHKDNNKIVLCGKLAIARSILQGERESLLYFERQGINSTINFNSLEKIWHLPFFQLLTENCSENDLKIRFQSLTVMVLNYDRCIEQLKTILFTEFFKLILFLLF
jgi:hypothetical protein